MHKLLHFKSHENCQVVSGITADDKKKKKKKSARVFVGLLYHSGTWWPFLWPLSPADVTRCPESGRETGGTGIWVRTSIHGASTGQEQSIPQGFLRLRDAVSNSSEI